MSLAERIDGDIAEIFYRESEFARRHSYNGREILCILDAQEARKGQNPDATGITWDAGAHIITMRVPTGELEDEPLEGERITLDGKLYTVHTITDNEGEWVMTLKRSEARAIV